MWKKCGLVLECKFIILNQLQEAQVILPHEVYILYVESWCPPLVQMMYCNLGHKYL